MSHPLPLVTLTLTTDEIAMASAALILLRQRWQGPNAIDSVAVGKMVLRINAFKDRLDEEVSPEQGRALFVELIEELKRKR